MIEHKIIVMKRIITYHISNRWDKFRQQRRAEIKKCIKVIRRLQTNPTDKDKYDNPAHPFPGK